MLPGFLRMKSSLGVKAHWNGVSADGTLAAGTCQPQPPSNAPRLHSYCLSSRKLPHCGLFWQADSVNKTASITFTVVEKSSDHSEVAEGWANSASGRHISSIADLWTGRNCSWFKPWGSSASWEIQHHNVSIPGASELWHAWLWVTFTARVCVAGESSQKGTSAVMNSTYVCGGGGGKSRSWHAVPLYAQYNHLYFNLTGEC